MEQRVLIGDIGGTNARFALTDPDSRVPTLQQLRALPAAQFDSLQHAAEHYLAQVQVTPRRAVLAVASPVTAEEINLTNRGWSFRRAELESALGLDTLRLINDFAAIAHAVPAFTGEDLETLHASAHAPLRGPVTVIGPGTGLGVALLTGHADQGWHVTDTEGGHVTFAPLDDDERRVAEWLGTRFGRASTERLLSGAGLSHIDAALRQVSADVADDAAVLRPPEEIVTAAVNATDADAARALALFCRVLGSVAGDAALLHGARTVMIAGGVVPRFLPFLRGSGFRQRFVAKGRLSGYLEAVAIHVVVHPQPGLLGAAVAARQAHA